MEQFSNAIAVLGVYIALMSVLAVGVEAILGWIKIPIPRLQSKPSPEVVLNEIGDWLPEDKANATKARINALNKTLTAIGKTRIDDDLSGQKLFEAIGNTTTQYIESERKRRSAIRAIAIVLGVGVAVVFQLDTFELLAPILGEAQNLIQRTFGPGLARYLGIVLSGIAASAGSSFWHDRSAQLRSVKEISAAAAEVR